MPQGQNYTYLYPNQKSYALLPVSKQHGNFTWQGRSLRHGYIFGYKETAPASSGGPPIIGGVIDAVNAAAAAYRQINYNNYKMFQFNPPALSMSASLMNVEDAEVQASGGNLSNPAVGLASSSLELFFDRTSEIARAHQRLASGSTYTNDEIWRDLGVQVDLFDFFKVISGGDKSLLGQYTEESSPEGGVVRSGSMNHLTGSLFDAAIAGSKIMYRPFAVVFNPNLTMHVNRMTNFAFTYLRFTPDLVPTSVKLEIGLEITNMGTKSYTTSGGTAGPTDSSSAPPNVSTAQSVAERLINW